MDLKASLNLFYSIKKIPYFWVYFLIIGFGDGSIMIFDYQSLIIKIPKYAGLQ